MGPYLLFFRGEVCNFMPENNYKTPVMGQGPAKLVAQELEDGTMEVLRKEDYDRHTNSKFTGPNLHRMTDPKPPHTEVEVAPRDYMFSIQGYDSYRTTEVFVHDEDSTDTEIP